jgi:GalNAc-alpha-(1->4)-GalNAc-alpha-(1->3)-diNAcBac-PP-undecaprenol alpha-1,4-N-acetyl-D-galactosaminyltransferase
LRILFLISSLNSGGAERVATTLCNAWVARHDSVTLVPTFSGGGNPFYALDKRVELTYLSSLVPVRAGSGKRYLARLLALRRLVRECKPDVVISFLPNVNIAALAATAFTGVPCIVCERSDPSQMPIGRFWRTACNWFYRFADLVAVQTEAVASGIGSVYGGLRRVAIVPNPLPEGLLLMRTDSSATPKRHTLLSLGRLSQEKQVGQIVEVFASLAADFQAWDLHVHGDGPECEAIQAQINALGLHERVLLKGRSNEPWLVMAEADAFVMNSRFEGFPNAMLEAMGVGLPCVVADCPSGPRDISANGRDALLFSPGDVQGFRAALAQIMGDPDLRLRLGKQARASVIERYSLEAVLKTWDGLFTDVRKASL